MFALHKDCLLINLAFIKSVEAIAAFHLPSVQKYITIRNSICKFLLIQVISVSKIDAMLLFSFVLLIIDHC